MCCESILGTKDSRSMNNVQSNNKLIGALNVVHSPANSVLCLDFIDLLQNHCLFYQSPANITHILEISCKEIVYIRYQSKKKKENKF